jgi:hypothetical protein
MAQSALTVTAPSPTPPTNFSSTGASPPNVPNYAKTEYVIDRTNRPPQDAWGAGAVVLGVAQGSFDPAPFFDDGTAGALQTFAANTAALASGTGATSGGTENTYPGTDTAPFDTPNCGGAVPASSSVAAEGSGTEVTVLAPGNRSYTYEGGGTLDMSRSASCGPTLTPGTMPQPNQLHASSLSPATNPALASISPTTATSGASGTDTITFTGTNFTRQSVVWVQHGTLTPVRVATTYVSATSLTAPVPKRTSAGTSTVYVVTGGAVETVTKTITYS